MESTVEVRVEDLPLNDGVKLLASNEDGLVALDKPAGAMSHPNKNEDIKRSLLQASYDYQGEYYFWKDEKDRECRAWLINRLDSPTSGVILLALNPEIADAIKKQFSTHKVVKHYHAIVRKEPSNNAGTWSDVISKDVVNNGRKIKRARKIQAKANYQIVSKPLGGFPVCLLKLMPVTGRTHQLRIQCRKHGHPIVGDRTYGNFPFNKEIAQETGEKRMMLHSSETIVNYTFKGKVCVFKAKSELPEAFHHVLRYRPGLNTNSPSLGGGPEKSKNQELLQGRRFKGV